MVERESICINNEWKMGSGPSFSSCNPATRELLWEGREAELPEVNEAVAQAKAAFAKWSRLPINERSRYLSNFAEVLREVQRDFAEIISKETGKPLWDSLTEVESMIGKISISLESYGRRCAGIIRDQPHARSITRHRPYGVVGVLGPYNLPGHLPISHIVPALLAGNTVVFKPSKFTPLTAETTLRCWQKAELPAGVLNLVQGGEAVEQAMIDHSDVRGLFFNGSCTRGQRLSQALASQPSKILVLGLGGNNPLVVGELENCAAAAYIVIQSAYLTSGQRLTSAKRLIVPKTEQGDELIQTLANMISGIAVGSYADVPEPFMGPVISAEHAQAALDQQGGLRAMGGEILVEMRSLQAGTGFLSPGLMDVTSLSERRDEEMLAPFLQVIRVSDFQEAIEEANRTQFGLAAGLLSQREEEYAYFYQHIQAGIVNWNTPLTGASSAAPFGGLKGSGNHRPSGYYAADYCAYPVASLETPELKMPSFFSPGLRIDAVLGK